MIFSKLGAILFFRFWYYNPCQSPATWNLHLGSPRCFFLPNTVMWRAMRALLGEKIRPYEMDFKVD